MILLKKGLVSIILFVLLTLFIKPVFANDDTQFVWSDINTPAVETVVSLAQDKRKFFKSYLW